MEIKRLVELAEELFTKKKMLNSLHQEVAEHFCPARADFTVTRPLGTDFAANLMSSYPSQCARTLGDQFSTMLRPTARPWFHVGIRHTPQAIKDNETRRILEWFEEVQRRAMYDPVTSFTRATKEGDQDFAVFGQCVISVEMNRDQDALLYRSWHLRDCAWMENEDGKIGFFARKSKPTIHVLNQKFGSKVHDEVKKLYDQAPFEEVECMHLIVEAAFYDDNSQGRPRWSLWYDITHQHLMEAVPIWNRHYVVPRWVTTTSTLYGSQYAYSPAVICALPDARLVQAMTFTLLEAGEKATSPPIIATKDVVRSDLALYAGGVTWVDQDYDERLGEALRPLNQDFRGFNFGVEMNKDTRMMISSAFFLDKLTMPQRGPEMTAYEVGQRVQEYVRNALPIFEPVEMEYNAAVCDETFDILWRRGAFGDPRTWPKSLRGAEVSFNFESPLHDAIEQQKGQKYQEAQQLIGQAVALDPSCAFVPRAEVALREALAGIGVPSVWLNSESFVAKAKAQQAAQQQAQQKLAAMEQGSNIVKNVGQSGMVSQQPQSQLAPA